MQKLKMIKYKVFVISISNPILVGIYQNNKLIQTISKDGKTSDILPTIIEDIIKTKKISEVYFVNGPGSYMAIKIAYIFLKTFCQVKDIPLFACSGFEFNQNSPIKALGKKYFFKNKQGKIETRLLNSQDKLIDFNLPQTLDMSIFSIDTLPNYQLPVV
jgi:tRNA A37 threonylcarbamoyladenosine modification protein TsaB